MTVYEIARLAGVSPGTVSKALNGRPGVSEETRLKVLGILRDYDLSFPERPAATSSLVGILVSDISNLYFSKGAGVIQEVLTENGYCPVILETGLDAGKQLSALKLLRLCGIEGVITVGSSFSGEEVGKGLQGLLPGVPAVMLNGLVPRDGVSLVRHDIRQGVGDAVRYMHKTGCRRFAFLRTEDTPMGREKVKGFREALSGLSLEGAVIDAGEDTFEAGFSAASRDCFPFDAVIASTDIVAAGALSALKAKGKGVPEDVSLFGIDNTEYSRITSPTLSTVDCQLEAMSYSAASLLLTMLRKPGEKGELVYPCALVPRESTKKAP